VIAKWLEVVELEDSTRDRYDGLIRLYITPTFGDLPAAKLDAELLERFYARLRRCNRLCSGRSADHECRPLSASTVRQVHFVLRAALDRAVRWRYLGSNEAAFAEPPAFERADPDPPSAEEVAALLNDAWQNPAWGLFLWLVMVTGCRRGEMCALRWTDLDLVRGTMTVERSYSRTRSRAHEKSTKTNQKRRISIDAGTVDLLNAYHEQCRQQCEGLDVALARDAFVFSGSPDFSTPLLPDTATQRYRRLARRLGLRSTRLHALRHYSATELLIAGVDLRTVAGRLGHGSGGATTLRFYAAWVHEADRRAADAIAKAIPQPDLGRREPRNPYETLAAGLRAAIESGQPRAGETPPHGGRARRRTRGFRRHRQPRRRPSQGRRPHRRPTRETRDRHTGGRPTEPLSPPVPGVCHSARATDYEGPRRHLIRPLPATIAASPFAPRA
jgi:integrase